MDVLAPRQIFSRGLCKCGAPGLIYGWSLRPEEARVLVLPRGIGGSEPTNGPAHHRAEQRS